MNAAPHAPHLTSPLPRLLVALAATLLLGGCGALATVNLQGENGKEARTQDERRSPGRVRVSEVKSRVAATRASCGGACTAGAKRVARMAGSLRAYPLQLSTRGAEGHGWRGERARAVDVTTLMDRAFSAKLGFDAVVIDAWNHPDAPAAVCRKDLTKPCAYVLRREPAWSWLTWDSYAEARAWLPRNTLTAVAEHFATSHVAAGKQLFVKLHDPMACAMSRLGKQGQDRCNDTVRNVVRRLVAIDSQGGGQRLRQSLRFVSESRDALALAHKQAEDMGLGADRVRYVWLAGSTFYGEGKASTGCGLMGASAQVLAKVRRESEAWLAKTAWLNEVWVQPRCFMQAPKLLAGVNAKRAAAAEGQAALPAIQLGVAAWSQTADLTDAWLKRHAKAGGKPAVASLVFDVDED